MFCERRVIICVFVVVVVIIVVGKPHCLQYLYMEFVLIKENHAVLFNPSSSRLSAVGIDLSDLVVYLKKSWYSLHDNKVPIAQAGQHPKWRSKSKVIIVNTLLQTIVTVSLIIGFGFVAPNIVPLEFTSPLRHSGLLVSYVSRFPEQTIVRAKKCTS